MPWENEVGRPNPFCKVGKDSGKILTAELSFKAFTREGKMEKFQAGGTAKAKVRCHEASSYVNQTTSP